MGARVLVPFLVVAAVAAAAWAETPVEVGPRIAVSGATTWHNRPSVVATDAQGNFVVAWESSHPYEGFDSHIWARRFDRDGRARGPEFRVNSTTSRNSRSTPALASDPAGGFVVAWSAYGVGYHRSREIFARRFDAAGTPLGPEFQVNTYTPWPQGDPAVAMHGSGEFVVAWHGTSREMGGGHDVFAQRFDAAGTPTGPEFVLNTYTTHNQSEPSLAMDAAGRFVALWYSYGQDGDGAGIFGQRFGADGSRLGPEFQVNTYTTGQQREPSVASRPDGAFMVAWNNREAYRGWREYVWEIEGRTFDADGNATGPVFHVNTQTTGLQYFPEVARDGDQGFVVKWSNGANAFLCIPEEPCPPPPPPAEYFGLARRFDALGAPVGATFLVASCSTTRCEHAWDIAGTPDGYFVVVGSSGRTAYAQRHGPAAIFSDGFESQSLAAWSAAGQTAGELSVSREAALDGSAWGLEGRAQTPGTLFVQDDSPRAEKFYRARFAFDPRTLDPGEAQGHYRARVLLLFSDAPSRRVASVVLRRRQGEYAVMARARLDDNRHVDTGFVPITAAPHTVELEWARATGTDAGDGFIRLRLDGSPAAEAAGLDNDRAVVDFVRLGAANLKAGVDGAIRWDEFTSERGPIPEP